MLQTRGPAFGMSLLIILNLQKGTKIELSEAGGKEGSASQNWDNSKVLMRRGDLVLHDAHMARIVLGCTTRGRTCA
eukprot:6251909-Amphidinium_carterae.1